jgi:hypothetical protein
MVKAIIELSYAALIVAIGAAALLFWIDALFGGKNN